ncbi:MAG: hypothetical protein Q8P41_17575 [Pseudomonadota bacterium]|nr:hypothetical protein [Pseudomonadota bacterium]
MCILTLRLPACLPSFALFALSLAACQAPAGKEDPASTADPDGTEPTPGDVAPGDGPEAPGGAAPGEDTGASDGETGETGGETGDPGEAPVGVGSCDAWDEPLAVAEVTDGALTELSDLVPSRANPGVLWGHQDSGGEPILYAIDGATGDTLGTLTLLGVDNSDWEDLAVAPCPGAAGDCVWVGDVGDNGLSRDDVALHTVPEPTFAGTLDAAVTPTTYRFEYPDGRGNVEGLAVGPDGLPILVTKRVDATADVYRFPTLDASATVTLAHVARIPTGDPANEHAAEATSADISPDGTRLLVRTYDSLLEYPLTDGVPGDPVSLPAPDEPQGEAAAYDPVSGGVWLTSEGTNPTVWFVACLAPARLGHELGR